MLIYPRDRSDFNAVKSFDFMQIKDLFTKDKHSLHNISFSKILPPLLDLNPKVVSYRTHAKPLYFPVWEQRTKSRGNRGEYSLSLLREEQMMTHCLIVFLFALL